MIHVAEDRDISIKSVPATYRGDISELKLIPNGDSALSQGPDFKKMAESALQYLINNPDPAHEYQSRFNLYLLWCPCFAPQAWEWGYGKKLREDGYHID